MTTELNTVDKKLFTQPHLSRPKEYSPETGTFNPATIHARRANRMRMVVRYLLRSRATIDYDKPIRHAYTHDGTTIVSDIQVSEAEAPLHHGVACAPVLSITTLRLVRDGESAAATGVNRTLSFKISDDPVQPSRMLVWVNGGSIFHECATISHVVRFIYKCLTRHVIAGRSIPVIRAPKGLSPAAPDNTAQPTRKRKIEDAAFVVVHAPATAGRSQDIEALKSFYKCDMVSEELVPSGLPRGARVLVLTENEDAARLTIRRMYPRSTVSTVSLSAAVIAMQQQTLPTKYVVSTFTNAGFRAKWFRNPTGTWRIAVTDASNQSWVGAVLVSPLMWKRMQREGIASVLRFNPPPAHS